MFGMALHFRDCAAGARKPRNDWTRDAEAPCVGVYAWGNPVGDAFLGGGQVFPHPAPPEAMNAVMDGTQSTSEITSEKQAPLDLKE